MEPVRDLVVKVGAAVADAPTAEEAPVHIPVHPGAAGQRGIFHHLPADVRALVQIPWWVVFCQEREKKDTEKDDLLA